MVTEARRDAKPKALILRDVEPEKATETEFDFGPETDVDPEARAPSVQHPRDKYKIGAIVQVIENCSGVVTIAAQKLRCERKTIYRYAERYWEVQEAIDRTNEVTIDFAEAKLQELMRGGNVPCLIFYLKTKGRKRGYSERFEISGPNGGPVPVKLDVAQTRAGILGDLRRIADRSGAGRVAQPANA